MSVTIGTKLGCYEITALIGAGGMGEVYRAHDTKLKRDVAIKILPDEFCREPARVSRFQREAEVLASLNHPNIAAIYELEEVNDARFLVLELVAGETLADRIRRGRIPVDEALAIAHQIAEAFEAAHEKGVIHRDLKPGNIKLTSDGIVKVLDFGLAKVLEPQRAGAALCNAPTMMAASTPGMIMGTTAYMSPEQARGEEVDHTTDVWAFGCVLYEMLTGCAAFDGKTVGEIFAEIFQRSPDWNRLPLETPQPIRRLLRRCLEKNRKERLQHVGDARIEINEAKSRHDIDDDLVRSASRHKERLAWISAIALVMLIAVVAIVWVGRPALPAPPAEIRLEIRTPPTSATSSLAISPDGQKIVFAGESEGQSRLWLRSLDSLSARPLVSTESASDPFWSPDGRSVGFFADAKLKRIDVEGGSPQVLANAPAPFSGGTWNANGIILFTPIAGGPIFRASATGDEPVAVTREALPGTSGHYHPKFLPDGQHFLFRVADNAAVSRIYIGQLDRPEARRLLDADETPVYAASGYLLFIRQQTLFAQKFDAARLELSGNPFPVAEQVLAVSASAAGPILYRTGSSNGQSQFVWFERSGHEIGNVGDPHNATTTPSISPDGQRLAVFRYLDGNNDVWFLELARGVLTRFTFDPAHDIFPIWSPNGSSIVFTSSRKGVFDLYQKAAAGGAAEELLLATAEDKFPSDWSPDGRFLLYDSFNPETQRNIWALPFDGDRKPFPTVQTNFDERRGQFSPDGKWIAYQSNESGRYEIYVQPFPGPGDKLQISTSGGAQVRWRRDGKELFYIALDGRLMAVPIRLASSRQVVAAGAPVPLFVTHPLRGVITPDGQEYIVSSDGQRFLINTVTGEAAPSSIAVILNWNPKK